MAKQEAFRTGFATLALFVCFSCSFIATLLSDFLIRGGFHRQACRVLLLTVLQGLQDGS